MQFEAGWRHRRRWRRLKPFLDGWDPPDPGRLLEQVLEDREFLSRLPGCLYRLPPHERRLIEMRFGLNNLDEQTLEALAKQRGTTRQSVHKQLKTILRRLRQWIEQPVVNN